MKRHVPRWRWEANTLLALVVFGAAFALLASTASMGFVRDEGYYFRAAEQYHAWFERLSDAIAHGGLRAAFSDEELRQSFGYNTEHPGLIKIAMGWTWRLATRTLGLTDHATGFRLGSIVFVALGAAFTFLLGARAFGRPVGVLGVALLFACPHVFYHSHLACFDGPIMGLTVVVTYGFWRALTSRAWVWGVGIAFGAALATKHNAVFLYFTLGLAYLLARVDRLRAEGGRLLLWPIPHAAISMALLGPLVLVIFYPFGWHDPIGRIGDYYRFHLHHEHYPVSYFGTLLTAPPFPVGVPFVLSALTIPLPVLLPGLLGLGVLLRRGLVAIVRARQGVAHDDPLVSWLFVCSILAPITLIAVPSVPIFGGTKHWMTMMPFFCLVAAWVIVTGARACLSLPRMGYTAGACLLMLPLLVAGAETVRTHPFGQTAYNELALGHQGGAVLGMPRTFWGGDARPLLQLINEGAAPGARVYSHRLNMDAFVAYQRDGLLRKDLRRVLEPRQAQWALVYHQKEHEDDAYEVRRIFGPQEPAGVVAIDGVPLVSLYRRD